MLLICLGDDYSLTAIYGTLEDAGRIVNSETHLPHVFAVSTDGVEMPVDTLFLAEALENGMEKHAIAHHHSNSPYGHVCDRECRIRQFDMLIKRYLKQG